MGNFKEEFQKIYDECTRHYYDSGASAVHDHVVKQQEKNNPMYADVKYQQCTACDTGRPTLNGICLVCGSNVQPQIGRKVRTIGEVRELIKDLDNKDIIVLEACDKDGEAEDLYPMYIDIIGGVERGKGIVNEVRFCQMPNIKPEVKPEPVVVIPDMLKIKAFAIAMSDLLFSMRTEDSFCSEIECPNTGTIVTETFLGETLNNEEHINKIKEEIRLDVVHRLTNSPNDWKNESGEYEYQVDIYDFAYQVDNYVAQLYEDTNETKSVWICPDCRSDNVQFKTWTNANTMKASNEECPMEDGDCCCNDCESTSILEIVTMMPRRKLIGFQVGGADGVGHPIIHPDMKSSSSVYNLEQAKELMLTYGHALQIDWELRTVWTDDLECPEMMFEGNIR